MRILFITHKWQAKTGESCSNALMQLGHNVELAWGKIGSVSSVTKYYNWLKRTKGVGKYSAKLERYILNRIIIQKARLKHPDLIIVNSGGEVFPETLKELRRITNARIVCWAGDNPSIYPHAPHYLEGVKFYDHYFIGDPSWYTSELKGAGVRNCSLLSYGADPKIYRPTKLNKQELSLYQSDVTHLGVLHDVRKELLLHLLNFDLAIWGAVTTKFLASHSTVPKELIPLVKGGIVQANISNLIYNATKVCLNILHPQLTYCYNNKTFEIAASHSFQLINYRDNVYRYYDDDELISFSSFDELKHLLVYYLQNDSERNSIAHKAYLKTLTKHLFIHRMTQLLEESFV